MNDQDAKKDVYEPLPVLGYTPQLVAAVEVVNENKRLEELVLCRMDELQALDGIDRRWLAIARTHIEQGFMAANRAVFKPNRLGMATDRS